MTALNKKHGMRNGMVVLHKTRAMGTIKSMVAMGTEFWYNIERLYINLMLYKTMRAWKHNGGSTIVYKLLYF